MSGEHTLGALLGMLRQRFSGAGLADAASDARHLLCGLLEITPTTLLVDPDRIVSAADAERIETAAARRLNREPVHRILGAREFFGLSLSLSPETLEPRPDTEMLVERALFHLGPVLKAKGKARIVDFGTGTGAIALAILSQYPDVEAVGVDISEDALLTAKGNAERLGLQARFSTHRGNWAEGLVGPFDMILSNPPYIPTAVVRNLEPEVRLYDPQAALDGGEDGLDAYRILARSLPPLMTADGLVLLEIGYDQKDSVTALFEAEGLCRIEAVRDYGDNDRVLVFRHGG